MYKKTDINLKKFFKDFVNLKINKLIINLCE